MTPGANPMCIVRPENAAPMRSSPMAPTGRRAGPAPPPISPRQALSDDMRSQGGEPAGATAGFTLLEMTAVIAIVAMLAAVLLPSLPRSTSRQRLSGYAVEAAALLKADRTAAVRRNTQVNAQIDASGHVIRSGSTGR